MADLVLQAVQANGIMVLPQPEKAVAAAEPEARVYRVLQVADQAALVVMVEQVHSQQRILLSDKM
jgi:hypothetical protein